MQQGGHDTVRRPCDTTPRHDRGTCDTVRSSAGVGAETRHARAWARRHGTRDIVCDTAGRALRHSHDTAPGAPRYDQPSAQCARSLCSVPRAQPNPIRESEPKPQGCSFYFFLFFVLLNILFFFKCHDPNPSPDPNGGSELEPDLLRRFHLSYQNILLCHFVGEVVSVLGKPIIIYQFHAIR